MILPPDRDPMGTAIRDYHRTGSARQLRVCSTMFDEDELPVPHLFRTRKTLPPLEVEALDLARGRVLDVGAGAGCHALPLQNAGFEVTALDISPLAVEVMRERGLRNVVLGDFFTDDFGHGFDTILMLMNGIGICGGLNELPAFFHRLDHLLADGGSVLTDSCDLRFVLGDEEGNIDPEEFDGYYGEVDYRMCYAGIEGEPFNWLYVDFSTLSAAASASGFVAECLREGVDGAYLARLVRAPR